jgi:hypothetical protein
MPEIRRPDFLFHASAMAFSGHVTRPLEHLIEAQAGTSLPTTGGHGSARVENFRFNEMVSFKAGYSQVSGSEKKVDGRTVYTTLSSAVLEGLNIQDVVTADRIVARLSSTYDPEKYHGRPREDHESRILTIGSRFENLRVAGCKVEVELHDELALELGTFEGARKKYKNDANFRKIVDDSFPKKAKANGKEIAAHGSIHCSLVKKFDPKEYPGLFTCHGYVLEVEEFGNIYLAEVLLSHGSKTLTMLRVELGSPSGGGFTGSQGSSNGLPPGGSG